ncbi:hypothetical protein [Oceanisphaera ostreae]|uniref:Type 4 fimbrial biogenesis protein PilX N-terminal domain-containing protein n=1 Tax=Oceanisphaera ostreae TaxID=914151 RepID=A0ABW3KDV6_9GAMM
MSLKPFRQPWSRQKGSMLISVLFMIVVLGGLMAAMSTLSSQSSQQLVYEVKALKARLIAESVLEQQIYASLGDIEADEVYSEADKYVEKGCSAYIHPLESPLTSQVKQINIIATGECSSGQLTVIRNIEVEVIER